MTQKSNGWALIWAFIAAIVAAFGQELTLGHVPLPPEWRWVVPILVAGIAATSPYLQATKERR